MPLNGCFEISGGCRCGGCRWYESKAKAVTVLRIHMNQNHHHDLVNKDYLLSALFSLMKDEIEVENQGEELANRMRNVTIDGIDGPVIINSNGDRLDEYSIMRLEEESEVYSPVLVYSAHHRQLREVAGQEMRWQVNCSNSVYSQVVARRLPGTV